MQDEESKRLHDELVQARKEADRVRLDRAETVNRLTKSLEQSQKQNEELLNSGTVPLYHIFVPLTILSSTQTFSVGRCIRRTGGRCIRVTWGRCIRGTGWRQSQAKE